MNLRPTASPSLFTLRLLWLLAGFWKAATCPAQTIELTEKEAELITIESAEISAELTGSTAVTTFDLVFRNPNPRVLEGTLLFPLLDGQSVIHFAVDINNSMREAVPIEKPRGRVVFEEVERRGSDQDPLDQEGNVFRSRIYPIPARGTRHVRISYQENLTITAEQSMYRLNLDIPRLVSHFRLALNVHSGASLPAQARTTLDLQLPPWRDAQFMEMERTDFDPRGTFEVVLPKADRARVITGRFNGKEYFYSEVPSIPLLFSRPAPKVVGILWDSSASGRERNHEREFSLLSAWFADLKNVEVRLVRLRDRASRDGTFTVANGDWAALHRELENTVYDGATSLDGLADDPKVETWICFSDGLINYGASDSSPKISLRGIVHAVSSSTTCDALWLRTLAAHRGGEYINLLETSPSQAAFTLATQSMRILAVEYDPAEVTDVFPEPGTPILGDSFSVTGILRKNDVNVRLLVGHNRENAQPIELSLFSGDDPSELAPRAWALAKINQLAAVSRFHTDESRQISREFGIVTSTTSLVVLETVNDYLRYNVAPPEDLRMEWEARQPAQRATPIRRDEHLESVVEAFQERVEWWEKTYPTTPPKPRPTRHQPERSDLSGTVAGPAEAPPPAEDEIVLSPFKRNAAGTRRRPPTAGPEAMRTGLARELNVAPEISLQKWSPHRDYLEHLRRSKPERRYATYVDERPEHEREPGFYLDTADFFLENADPDTALRVLSNLAELELEDPALLRVLGYRLMQADRADLALPILERVAVLRPEEPQSRRDLALACAALGKYQRAVDLLWEIVSHPWDTRFPEVELIALEELNALVATCGQKLDLSRVDSRLQRNLPLDLRVVLSWDANDADIDLWVTDPNGEAAKYDFPLTYQGGLMSRDFTGGYGPEEFILRKAKAGKYGVQINYYGDRRQTALGPVTAQVRLVTGFGTPNQQEKRLTVRLKDKQETLDLGSIEMGKKKSGR